VQSQKRSFKKKQCSSYFEKQSQQIKRCYWEKFLKKLMADLEDTTYQQSFSFFFIFAGHFEDLKRNQGLVW